MTDGISHLSFPQSRPLFVTLQEISDYRIGYSKRWVPYMDQGIAYLCGKNLISTKVFTLVYFGSSKRFAVLTFRAFGAGCCAMISYCILSYLAITIKFDYY